MKKIISLSAALLLSASLAVGCGKDKNSSSSEEEKAKSKYEGKWQCSQIVIDNEPYNNFFGADAEVLYQIELTADNKGTYRTFLSFDSDKAQNIEWKEIEENKIELTGEDLDEPIDIDYRNGKLRIKMNDESSTVDYLAYLEQVDEFRAITENDGMSIEANGEASADFEISE